MTTAVGLRRFGEEDLPAIRQTLLDVHADAYAADMDDEFNQRFPWLVDPWGGPSRVRLRHRLRRRRTGRLRLRSAGGPGPGVRRGYLSEPPADDSAFSVSELMVRPAWRKTGTAACVTTS
ncbi:hypothetical protein ACXZ65_38550 [Streptomyces aculeolatus]